jgi:hypothetical protein
VIIERGIAFAFDFKGTNVGSADATEMSSSPIPFAGSGCTRLRCWLVAAAVATLLSNPSVFRAAEDGPQSIDIAFSPYGTIRWQRGGRPVLLVYPQHGDGWINLARRYTGNSAAATSLKRANPNLRNPMRGRHVRVPIESLRGDLRLEAVRRLFPVDQRIDAGWQHWVLDPLNRRRARISSAFRFQIPDTSGDTDPDRDGDLRSPTDAAATSLRCCPRINAPRLWLR